MSFDEILETLFHSTRRKARSVTLLNKTMHRWF